MNIQQAIHHVQKRRMRLITQRARINKDGSDASRDGSTNNASTRVIATLLRQGLLCTALLATSTAKADLCSVHVMFTLSGGSALQQVNSTIYQGEAVIVSHKEHSYTESLTCGLTYRVEGQLGNTTRGRTFTGLENANIIIEMGNN